MLERFERLTNLLLKHEVTWKTSTFKQANFRYLDQQAELKQWLFSLSDHELASLQSNDTLLLNAIFCVFPDAAEILELLQFPSSISSTLQPPEKFWDTDIPGRKASQILAFSDAVGKINHPILEWCCGKQHLGRFLSEVNNQPSEGLEIDTHLVAKANELSKKRKLHHLVITHECDVFSTQADHFIKQDQHIVALHACGGLHAQLLKKCAEHQVNQISVSPCCYHRFNASERYQALSKSGQTSALRLTMSDLRLAVQETKTASASETRKRRTLQAWRLGFDSLQRDIRAEDSYLETPSVNSSILNTSFKSFCKELAHRKNLVLDGSINYKDYQIKGADRFYLYERAELLRMCFRRALETWLILDRAFYLSEQGYKTSIEIFCSSDISPRNFMLHAQLHT